MPSAQDAYSEALEAIARAESVLAARLAVMDALKLDGMSMVYFYAPLTSDTRVVRILTAVGLPHVWERNYRRALHRIDPMPRFSLTVSGAFAWPEALEAANLSEGERRYLQITAKYGLGRGIGVACYGPQGRNGFLGVAWPGDSEPPTRVIQWVNNVGQSSFQRYCQLVRKEDLVPALSNRELEVLSWMCEGKSNSVIAQILNISRSSVDMYVRRLFTKLAVTDRTAACIRGFTLGLTVARDHKDLVEIARKSEPDNAI